MTGIGGCGRTAGHRFRPGEVKCKSCSFFRSLADVESELEIIDARYEQGRAEFEAEDRYGDGEWDVRSHQVER